MHILLVHNRYRQAGGEDSAFGAERSLLLKHGHTITESLDDNRRIDSITRLTPAFQTVW
jgi:hypothetical protein